MSDKVKEQGSIPVSKVQRAAKFISTGAKVGGNYVKHYAKKMVNPALNREELHQNNASDIYNSLSELKGSALKVAQMMSMDKNLLPRAYQDKFSMAQYTAPPLSYPLVVKTFQKHFQKTPEQLFDTFSRSAINAASIGQVHQATQGDKTFAVKIQYPGVGDSVSSDLKLVKPIALRLLNMNEQELNHYMQEVEERLLEETDYTLEIKRSREISESCTAIPNLRFPKYYDSLSSDRIITMDWLEGKHIKEWMETNPSQEQRNRIGQALWDFYHHQVHNLKQVHADPHPGNFIIQEDGTLGIIDFGCVKVIPVDFYKGYFSLIKKDLLIKEEELNQIFYDLEFISDKDTEEEKKYFKSIFSEMIALLGTPFHVEKFDFSNNEFFNQIFQLGDRIANDKMFKKSNQARGSRHGLYVNRTYFGIYNLLNQLKAEIVTTKPDWLS
ncbi:MAG: AarF/ABC1/UbiB kinase family protein [Algoriphagus sp.]|jgi:predicted unusual protein kinase regulating ubiquinone biosynthesis (AarF/ABC1/UbiB family)|uniref:ABC1 kinase family protein n=1 Tax=Algoriphagus sp. TaxID=1872435 RepID=UPI002778C381|nr:AarF/ABC1/UbiB kinase family protein [Algoriphagus sp.]MDP4748222.1 AarF/ABC1/UbiB kinase family protein [Algoriphagus sp.]MDP4838248.1 AarF/ABC1/UbiB kinase family protein [Algoriphagus sp.]MDP4904895.1 AarF/ABC1/UbiB kinase family protein [Algoriphagus sp.]MDP4958200.1 AarF/ABC1/UbiB kinase family protein [Algoriphagus sp.]